jgi:hypothetical protein
MFMFCHADAAFRAVIGCFLRLKQQELNGLVVVLQLGHFELSFDGDVGVSGGGVLLPQSCTDGAVINHESFNLIRSFSAI